MNDANNAGALAPTPNAPVEQREAIARLVNATTVSCSGKTITVECDDHDVKDALMDWLTDAAYAILAVHLDEAEIRKDEREKCAKIADLSVIADRAYALEYPDEAHKFDQRAHRGTTIASAIRNGGKQP